MADTPLLEMQKISKSFGPVQVLDDINLVVEKGEILGIIGENGAGKSTLIKILCGIYDMNGGQILWEGNPVRIQNAASAQALGISTIYQELSVMPHLTAVQNIFINRELAHAADTLISPLDDNKMNEIARKILHGELKSDIPLHLASMHLKLSQKQMIEIARTVYSDAKLIIMDEPTASLQAKERDALFAVIRELKEKGKSIIFISHHLDELMDICDKIVILRDGKKVAEGKTADFDIDRIITFMVGRKLEAQYVKAEDKAIGEEMLSVSNYGNRKDFQNISFSLRRGEALGIVGVEGCGKNELLRSLFGIIRVSEGEVKLQGRPVRIRNVKQAMNRGLAFVPAERKTEGLFLKQNVAWNTTIAALPKITKYTCLSGRKEKDYTEQYKDSLNTKFHTVGQNIARLSGGNQQKIMLSRWMMTDADIFLLEEPTRGIDVNAKTEVYRAVADLVRAGKSVIIVSSEEAEVLGVCDRILVMRNGEISAVLDAEKATEEIIKQYAYKDIQEGAQ